MTKMKTFYVCASVMLDVKATRSDIALKKFEKINRDAKRKKQIESHITNKLLVENVIASGFAIDLTDGVNED